MEPEHHSQPDLHAESAATGSHTDSQTATNKRAVVAAADDAGSILDIALSGMDAQALKQAKGPYVIA